ncbi:Lrp/AsnC family transcriptional regulator [Streptomyces montanisoli]|uniref:AsnC family transcriptional regulator n=1 Tax=Streptomyces montanisoli TaxID=2798581 RepID=A0A940MF57_9ACTN|nr:AsnC family transcriptional regulator [Streptomyces montanisoli]MBP0457996.1 AsnC family transcriptional regulator [Streptomyces montanisoli]
MTERDAIDELDFRLVHALEIDGRAPFSRIASVLGVSDQTIARRFRRLRTAVGLRVVGVRDAEMRDRDNWMLKLRVKPDAAEAVARALAQRPDTSWIGLTSAGTEIVCSTAFSSAGDHDELILGKLPRTPSVTDIRAHQLLHRFFGGPASWFGKDFGRDKALDATQIAALTPSWTHQEHDEDEPDGGGLPVPGDEPLLRALERDGRTSIADLAAATGGTESATRRRLDRLLRSRALFLDVEFSTEALGYAARAILWITAEPRALETLGRALARQPEVAAAMATTGESNLVAVIVCRDSAAVYRYLNESLGRLDGVQRVEVSPVLRNVKQHT